MCSHWYEVCTGMVIPEVAVVPVICVGLYVVHLLAAETVVHPASGPALHLLASRLEGAGARRFEVGAETEVEAGNETGVEIGVELETEFEVETEIQTGNETEPGLEIGVVSEGGPDCHQMTVPGIQLSRSPPGSRQYCS